MPLFHCTHSDLSNDQIILLGNWGKKLFEIGPSHHCWSREMVLEEVRTLHFPQKPSRLKSTFTCDTIETIRHYKQQNCPDGFIYEVEIIDSSAPQHKGDFNAVQPLHGLPDDMWTIAQKYWQHILKTNVKEWPDVECSEIVTESPLRVIRKII